jgi:hypothetical protein
MATSYTTTSSKLKITELDFDSIKGALKTYLKGQTEFEGYDFDGSAMSILLDVLAYNTHYNGFYTNMLASEMFMDSASLRSSVVSLAKHLGYTPASKKGSSVEIDVTFQGTGTSILIPKGAKFTSKLGTNIYTYLITESRVAKFDTSTLTYVAKNVKIKEGIAFSSTQTVVGSTTNETFEIPNEEVDLDTLTVAVGGDIYTKADDFTEISSTTKSYFIQEGNHNKYEIYFGDGVIGNKPSVGELVQMEYNISVLGSQGNGAKTFVLAESLTGATSVTVAMSPLHTRSSGGSEREDTSTIRIQAPRQYSLQKRVVTGNDYKTRLENDYNIVDSVKVWGGEDNNPPAYGRVFISIKPKAGYVLSRAEAHRVEQEILQKRNVVTVKPKFVDPDYLWIIPDVLVAYDPRKSSRTADQLKALVSASILKYTSGSLNKFDNYFRFSVLSRAIDDSEESILNNNMRVAMKKRIKPIMRVQGSYRIHFDNPLYRPYARNQPIIESSLFTYQGRKNCMIIDVDGILKIVGTGGGTTVTGFNSRTNIREDYGTPLNSDIGFVDYNSGEMLVGPFKATTIADGSEYIYFSAKPRIDDIMSRENTIVTIDSSDITINCVDDTDRNRPSILEDSGHGY